MMISTRLRWLGMLFLILAGSLLVWGQTLLKPYLTGWAFIVYWLACFLFTGLAMLVALIDLRMVRKQIEQKHRQMWHHTMTDSDESSSAGSQTRRQSSETAGENRDADPNKPEDAE